MRQLPPNSPEYVIEGPLSGFVSDEGTFTMESEREFKDWLNDHLLDMKAAPLSFKLPGAGHCA
jgi:hypothetical protein